jgi:hypothetical protein
MSQSGPKLTGTQQDTASADLGAVGGLWLIAVCGRSAGPVWRGLLWRQALLKCLCRDQVQLALDGAKKRADTLQELFWDSQPKGHVLHALLNDLSMAPATWRTAGQQRSVHPREHQVP